MKTQTYIFASKNSSGTHTVVATSEEEAWEILNNEITPEQNDYRLEEIEEND